MSSSEHGPLHVSAELLGVKSVGAFHHLSLVAPGVARALPETPVLGCGGIMDTAGVRAHLEAGARAVQVGTALFHDPTTAFRIARELHPSHDRPTEPPAEAGEDA